MFEVGACSVFVNEKMTLLWLPSANYFICIFKQTKAFTLFQGLKLLMIVVPPAVRV